MAFLDCIARLAEAAGRELTDAEVTKIFERIHQAALDIKAGRTEPGEATLGKQLGEQLGVGQSQDQLIQAVAERASAQLLHEAEVRQRQAQLQVLAIGARAQDQKKLFNVGLKPFDALDGLLARDFSGKFNVESVEQRVAGVKAELKRQLQGTWDALGDDWLGFFQDRNKLITLVRELRGENTGDAVAKKGAEAFHNVAEQARQTFNAAGGDVGKLDDWGMPQHHSQERVATAGKNAWVDYILPKLDKARYVDDLGRPWSEATLRTFLGKAWDTIATNGIANIKPGEFTGVGKKANRHAEHRQIHFKDAESVIQYWNDFGEKTAVQILDGHIDSMAKDIAFIEKFGPNPDMTYQTLRDRTLKLAAIDNPTQTTDLQGRALHSDNLYDYASGKIKPTFNQTVSNVADGIAHLNSAGKLGGAAVASFFGDKVMYEAVSHLNNIPAVQRWSNELKLLSPTNAQDRRLLQRQGLMLESVRNSLNRFYEGLGGSGGGWSGKFATTTGKWASAVMRLTGMDAINEFRKGAFGLSLMSSIGHEISSGKDFNSLHDSDVRALTTFGIEEADWKIWKLARLDEVAGNGNVLTPEAISRIPDAALEAEGFTQVDKRNAIVKLLGAVNTESDFAIVTPGWRERAKFYGKMQRGTILGEVGRSILQFKSFPFTAFERSLDLVANADTPVGKAVMTSYLLIATTLAGAMLMQTRDMLAGRDPRRMNDENWPKFWAQAFLQGGALGIYGDFLSGAGQSRYGSGPLEMAAGPSLGPLLSLGVINPMNAVKAQYESKESHLLAKEIQDAKGFVPGGNIWYAKAAMDHLIWQRVMESLSPGYLATIRNRGMRDYHQDWWWAPGETSPERAPDFSGALQ